jgi:hypothetical protein
MILSAHVLDLIFFLLIYIMNTAEQGKYIFRSFKNVFIFFFSLFEIYNLYLRGTMSTCDENEITYTYYINISKKRELT